MQAKKAFWTQEGLAFYQAACAYLDYPHVPFGDVLSQLVRPGDTVLDIGSGIGAAALYLAPRCARVVAVEDDPQAVRYLSHNCAAQGAHNVQIWRAPFPDARLPVCDVSVALYVADAARTLEGARLLVEKTARQGLLVCNHPEVQPTFHQALARLLHVPSPRASCRNGCASAALLEAAGAREVRCEKRTHDFGQPVRDLDDAARFVLWQMHAPQQLLPQVRAHVSRFVQARGDTLYIPMPRSSCVIRFTR